MGLVLIGSFAALRVNPACEELWKTISKLDDHVDRSFIVEFQKSTLARPVPSAFLDTVVDESARVPVHLSRAMFGHFLEADFSSELPRIKAPTLILWGDQDAILSKRDQELLLTAIPGSRLLVDPGAGHAIHWKDPVRFTSDLIAFAADVRSDPASRSVVR